MYLTLQNSVQFLLTDFKIKYFKKLFSFQIHLFFPAYFSIKMTTKKYFFLNAKLWTKKPFIDSKK